jgi:hypothetical protein
MLQGFLHFPSFTMPAALISQLIPAMEIGGAKLGDRKLLSADATPFVISPANLSLETPP